MILVIDRITSSILEESTTEGVLALLCSSWLNGDWPMAKCPSRSDHLTPGPLIANGKLAVVVRCLSVHQPEARDLRDHWDE